jgi:nitroimidazol reductase NimA-like FMN-containing flavoprotein (pyridoxamine 5'-phosphate oxidase superfamily)
MEAARTRARLRSLLGDQQLAVLATVMDGRPHCNIVAFAHTPDLRRVLFATSRDSQKYRSLVEHPYVSMLVDSRANAPSDLMEAVAVTIDGLAHDLRDEKARFLGLYVGKHATLQGFAASPDTALICVDVTRYKIVTRFQDVQLLELSRPSNGE